MLGVFQCQSIYTKKLHTASLVKVWQTINVLLVVNLYARSAIKDIMVCVTFVQQINQRTRIIYGGWARIGTMDTPHKIKITWACKENFINERRPGYRINKWMVAACTLEDNKPAWRIYRLDTGKILTNIVFSNEDDALRFGYWIDEHYKEMFDIWEVMPELDLLAVTRYTIPNGIEVYNKIDELQNRYIAKGELERTIR